MGNRARPSVPAVVCVVVGLQLLLATMVSASTISGMSTDDSSPEGRASLRWHPIIREIAYGEAFFGNGRLDPEELSFLLAVLENRWRIWEGQEKWAEESFWQLVTSMPLACQPGTPVFNELISRAQQKSTILPAGIFLARAGSDQGDEAGVANLIARARDLQEGKGLDLHDIPEGRQIPYLVLSVPGRSVAAGVVEELVRLNEDLVPFVLDACTLGGADEGEPLSETVVQAALLAKGGLARICLAMYVARVRPTDGAEILSRILDTIPHKLVDGATAYVMNTDPYWEHAGVGSAVEKAEEVIELSEEYRIAKEEGRLYRLFTGTKLRPLIQLQVSWVLFRYNFELTEDILEYYLSSESVVVASNERSRLLLGECLEMASISEKRESTEFKRMAGEVRRSSFSGETAVRRANALALLKHIVREGDLGRLSALARDREEISWEGAGGRKVSGPLVAFRALACVKAIGTKESKEELRRIVEDSSVDPRVSDSARQYLAGPGLGEERGAQGQ